MEPRTADALLVHGVEGAEHGNANAEDGEVRLQNKKENGGGHGTSDITVEVDSGDVNEAEDGTDNTALQNY